MRLWGGIPLANPVFMRLLQGLTKGRGGYSQHECVALSISDFFHIIYEKVVCGPGRKCEPSRAILEKLRLHTRGFCVSNHPFTPEGEDIILREYGPRKGLSGSTGPVRQRRCMV